MPAHQHPTRALLARPVHHLGFNVPDLHAAIDRWVTVHGAGPFYVNEHVAYDEPTSSGTSAVWDHSAAFGQWGSLPVELQQTHDLRPPELVRPFTAEGRSAVNHVGITAAEPAAESARLGWPRPDPQARMSTHSFGPVERRRGSTAVVAGDGRREVGQPVA